MNPNTILISAAILAVVALVCLLLAAPVFFRLFDYYCAWVEEKMDNWKESRRRRHFTKNK